MTVKHTRRLVAPASFVAVVLAANLLTAALGVVHWAGIAATAGTWLAGFAFVARDATHEALGRRWIIGCILTGAAISAAFSPALAIASATAFLVSEFADYAVYAPLRSRGRLRAALLSNLAGSVVDSALFLLIAGFPTSLIWGQVGIKTATTTAFVVAIGGAHAVLRQPSLAPGGGRDA